MFINKKGQLIKIPQLLKKHQLVKTFINKKQQLIKKRQLIKTAINKKRQLIKNVI